MSEKMMAAVLCGDRDLQYKETEKPSPKAGEVLVRVRASGICGSDIPRVLHKGAHFFPIILGHEFSGEIAALGEGVEGFEIGDRVSGAPLKPCGKCRDCQKGNYSLCKHYSFIGSRENGSFAQYVCIPAQNAIKFDKSVSFEQGAMFEPSTVALHGVLLNECAGGEYVAVCGGGTIGLFTAQWAKIFGAKKVVVIDILDERLELAKKLGADEGFNSTDPDFAEKIKAYTGGRGFGAVYETAGSPVTMKMAFELAANKAHVCFIGTPHTDVTFTPKMWENLNRKEFRLVGSWMSYSAPFPGKEWELTAACFGDGRLKYDDGLVFAKYPLAKAWDAFELYLTPGAVKGRILLVDED